MSLQSALREVLQYLFDGYTEHGGTGLFLIDDITDKYKMNSHEVGRELVQAGLVKHQEYRPTEFLCAISFYGIQQIAPDYFNNLSKKVVMDAGQTNDWVGIMDTLEWESKDYQRAHDLGTILKDSGLAEVQYQPDDIWIKLTLKGTDKYNHEYKGGFYS